ncbi:unnamed protein product [Sphenostylis stenocarpa]|uniref:Uncharacterized protein n=1 Tax=Sphenostylis stenocarpa TaxID=92480 RepID=A0AA86TFU3_9FABA|nr:unnamed protein product [Sphenostylis stenocarpa]
MLVGPTCSRVYVYGSKSRDSKHDQSPAGSDLISPFLSLSFLPLSSILYHSAPLFTSLPLSSNSTFSLSDQMLQSNGSTHSLPLSFSSSLNKYPTASSFVRIAII